MRVFTQLNILLFFLIGCSEPKEFYNKNQRLKMREYEPNMLFSNFHILDCDKFILMKTHFQEGMANEDHLSIEVNLNFLKGHTLEIDDQLFPITNVNEQINTDPIQSDQLKNKLKFRLNQEKFAFPYIEPIQISNKDELGKIRVGTKIKWNQSNGNENVLLALKPGQSYCGKKGQKGQIYGTKPILVPDSGSYIIKAQDLVLFDPGMEIGILLKRGVNNIHQFGDDGEEICVGAVSYDNIRVIHK